MKTAVTVSLCCLLSLAWVVESGRGPFLKFFPTPVPPPDNGNADDFGKPLFLTPYIESGNLREARRLSLVKKLPSAPRIATFSGFLTVNKEYNSNLFFWFVPALNGDPNAPVLLWLQGGPGGSSLFGMFVEHGPFYVKKNLELHWRKYTWSNKFSVLYIDNPVGTGFSFTEDDRGYATNQTEVARDLYEALQQFFTLFHELRGNDFYVTGESYAGKYVPAIAYKIHTEGSAANISLKGIAIGDGYCDPATMFDYGDFLYQTGLVDRDEAAYIKEMTELADKYIQQEEWLKAFHIFDGLLNGDKTNETSYYTNATGLTFYYNYLHTTAPKDFQYYNYYLASPDVRKAIHVGNLTYHDGSIVEDYLLLDMMKSVKPWIAVLMENYKVLVYNGQLDIIVAYPLTVNFLQSVEWSGQEEYKNASRIIWKVQPWDKEVAGYVHHVKDFYEVLVRNAGHILPYDQPRVAHDLITRFVLNMAFTS